MGKILRCHMLVNGNGEGPVKAVFNRDYAVAGYSIIRVKPTKR